MFNLHVNNHTRRRHEDDFSSNELTIAKSNIFFIDFEKVNFSLEHSRYHLYVVTYASQATYTLIIYYILYYMLLTCMTYRTICILRIGVIFLRQHDCEIGFLLLYFQCKGPFRQFGKSTKSLYFLLCFALLFINNNM